jgi:hypothetical protein
MATNPILDIPIRQRQSTNVPLPFEKMYAVLMEKQKRYDQADAYERQAKKEMSVLSSPIADHNEYLNKNIKNPFMEKVMNLHNSFPDKGSSEFQRKLNDIVDSTVSDQNLNLIEQSTLEYDKFVKISAEQMAKGLYSNAAARKYKDFKGVNPDGTINKFQFLGLRSVKDVEGTIANIIAKTPIQENAWDITTINGRKMGGETKIKSTEVIYSGLKTAFFNDTELLEDAMDKYNAKTPQDLDKILRQIAKDASINSTAISRGWESSLLNRADAIAAAKSEQEQIALANPISDYPDDYNNKVLKQVQGYLDVNGNVKPALPAGNTVLQGSPLLMGSNTSMDSKSNGLTSTTSIKERIAYSKKKLLENPEFKAMVDNYMHAGLNQDAAIKKAGIELKNMPFTTKKMEGRYITNKDERQALTTTLQGLGQSLSFYDYKNPTGSSKKLEKVLEESGQANLDNLNVGAELAPIAGATGNQNYLVTLGDKSYIISTDSPYPSRVQSKMLFDAQRNKTSIRLKKYNPGLDDNLDNETLKQDAAKYGTDNVIIYTGLDGKLHLKREK